MKPRSASTRHLRIARHMGLTCKHYYTLYLRDRNNKPVVVECVLPRRVYSISGILNLAPREILNEIRDMEYVRHTYGVIREETFGVVV